VINSIFQSLSPGVVKTEIMSTVTSMPKEAIEAMMKSLPFLESKDIADAVVYLLGTPQNVLVTELTIRPMNETL
jgi:NADP+-dependent farnesol dehydrogenase